MNMPAITRMPARKVAGVLAWLVLAAAVGSAAQAAEYIVDNTNGACSAAGPGTPAAPFCTITDALTAHHQPGDVITVMPGTYREQVTMPASGLAGSPITLRAAPGGGPVIVDGTDDFSNPALWAQFSGDVWLAASAATSPVQVFADDQRLTPSTAPPASLPARSFTFVVGSGLYVNAGGGNPGDHHTQVGARLRGLFVSGKSYVVLQGFTVTRCEDRCIQLTNSTHVDVVGNKLSFSGGFGFQAESGSFDRIASNTSANNAGHGFSVINASDMTIEDNEGFGNADPAVRVANGLFVGASTRCTIRRNRWHDNQDSGEQFSPGCTDNVSLQNRSWANGDHGYDHNQTTGTLHLNDVAYGNFKDGFSIEGNSTGQRLFNCIAIMNGVTTNEYDLYVDPASTVGLQSNDNLFWNSGPQAPVKVGGTVYPTVAAYSAAWAQDTRSIQNDPRFVDAAHGDFHLSAGSPAIDDANSGVTGWPSTDAEGHAPADDPGMPNNGLGPVTFADRGALEFQGSSPVTNQPPVAKLTATPSSGTSPLDVMVKANGSTDSDGTIVWYLFDFGDGTHLGPQHSPVAKHTYGTGHWTVRVDVTDDGGATASAFATVDATGPPSNLLANGTFEAGTAGWSPSGGARLQRGNGGHTGRYSLLASAPLLGLAAYGATSQPVAVGGGAGATFHVRAWVRAELGAGLVSVAVTESNAAGSNTTRSSTVVLGTGWAAIDLDISTQFAGSSLSVAVVNAPSVLGTAFRVDDVSIMAGAGVAMIAEFAEDSPAPDAVDDLFMAPGVHPNPVRGDGARIVFATRTAGATQIAIYDLAGRRVRQLAGDPTAAAGPQAVAFDGRGDDGRRLPGGVYYYAVRTPGAATHGRLVIAE